MTRKSLITGAIFLLGFLTVQICNAQEKVEQWDCFEVSLKHSPAGNAFVDDSLFAVFNQGEKNFYVRGFYDGDGIYKIRFMPSETGNWTYKISSNVREFNGVSGRLTCVRPTKNNHGPVKVRNQYHFKYTDGKPFYVFGTTCYDWVHQGDSLENLTLKTLGASPFNKIRMCVFPKWYTYCHVEPVFYPFERKTSDGDLTNWDFERFNPDFFRHLEKRVKDLSELGIQADIILFHPYDKGHWGFDRMASETDIFYLKYLIARLGSYRNVWWSLANEYEFMKEKSPKDWETFISTIAKEDPYGHLCSVHNGKKYFDNWNSHLTHASIQNGALVGDFGRAVILRDAYKKPVIYDEVCYEGNIPSRWGNISAEEMTFRFWQGFIAGTYVTHGETLQNPDSVLWWSRGGTLKGESPKRIGFLKSIVEETGSLELVDHFWGVDNTAISENGDILIYFGKEVKSEWPFSLPKEVLISEGTRYEAEIIDTWNMTITPVRQEFVTSKVDGYFIRDTRNQVVKLPAKQYLALWLKKLN